MNIISELKERIDLHNQDLEEVRKESGTNNPGFVYSLGGRDALSELFCYLEDLYPPKAESSNGN